MNLSEQYMSMSENTEIVKIEVTDDNNEKIQKLFKKAKNNVISGEIKDATYDAYLTGVKKGSLGTLNIEIRSFVDSSTMKRKFKKEIVNNILGLNECSEDKVNLSEKYITMSEAKSIALPKVMFELIGFGKNTNGNSVAKFKNGRGKGFSIQTNGNLPATHSIRMSGKKAKELNDKELATIADETKLYIEANGTKTMREALDEIKNTVPKDLKSALSDLQKAEGSLYEMSNDLDGTIGKEASKIHKIISDGYDLLIKFKREFKKELSESIDKSLEREFTKKLSGWKIEEKNGVLKATKKEGDRLHTITFWDESQEGKYYAIEYKESDMKGNDINYNTLKKSKGVKPKYVIKEIENIISIR